jgi:hypothetical protein
VVQVRLHSTDVASRLAALLNAQILSDILASRALRSGLTVGLGATTHLHHGLLERALESEVFRALAHEENHVPDVLGKR